MKIKVVFDGGIEKEFITNVNVSDMDKIIEKLLNMGQNPETLRLFGNNFIIPYNKILYIEEVKD